jgi:hypothetical protein
MQSLKATSIVDIEKKINVKTISIAEVGKENFPL